MTGVAGLEAGRLVDRKLQVRLRQPLGTDRAVERELVTAAIGPRLVAIGPVPPLRRVVRQPRAEHRLTKDGPVALGFRREAFLERWRRPGIGHLEGAEEVQR